MYNLRSVLELGGQEEGGEEEAADIEGVESEGVAAPPEEAVEVGEGEDVAPGAAVGKKVGEAVE